jgi:hypothetical protein
VLEALKNADCKTKLKWLAVACIFLIVGGLLGYWLCQCIFSSTEESGAGEGATVATPVEFLLLDTTRVDSYLAQLTEGTEASKKLGEKLTKSASVGVDKVVKAQGELKEESFVEREVTPTASSRLIKLEEELGEVIDDKTVSEEEEEEEEPNWNSVHDGDMIRFTASVRTPLYVEPYLAISHEATVSALFPNPSRNRAKRQIVQKRREASWKFRRQVGKDPRIVLAVKQAPIVERHRVDVLMPVHMKQLSEERSLLHTGITFTVVGKVVRFFRAEDPQRDGAEKPSYVDLATLHTWLHAIRNAPDELICRASQTCSTKIEEFDEKTGKSRHKAILEARHDMIESLRSETRIGETGGFLIIPIAIYE